MFGAQHETPDGLEYDILKPPEVAGFAPDKPPASGPARIVIAVVIIAAVLGAYVAFWRSHREAPSVSNAHTAVSQPPHDRALGGDAVPVVVPPLDQSDALVRDLVKQITSHPLAAAWLTTDGLIRNFAVVLSNVLDGTNPSGHLRPLRPQSNFEVIERGGRVFIDPRSYRRYDGIAAAATSIDAAGAARLYSTLKPRIEEAFRDLGNPDTVDHAMEIAIVRLLEVPIVTDPIEVRQKGGTGYAFADPALESLTGPQRQLLRTGPSNVRAIQASLRAIAAALGIPATRLPPPHTT